MQSDPVLLYDGTCGLCSGLVRFILRRDRTATLRFATLDGEFAGRVREAFPELAGVDSVVWVDAGMGRVLVRSDAALRVARYLGGRWRFAAVGAVVPRSIRDRIYDLVARHRHQADARATACLVPGPDVVHRFL